MSMLTMMILKYDDYYSSYSSYSCNVSSTWWRIKLIILDVKISTTYIYMIIMYSSYSCNVSNMWWRIKGSFLSNARASASHPVNP